MKPVKKLLTWTLRLCLLLGMLPAVYAGNSESFTVTLTGNAGTSISCGAAPLSAEVDDNALAIVEIRGSKVNVIGKENAVGVARLTIQTASGYHVFDIPIGYTTFVFDGGKLTVIEGDSANYEVAGVNPANEEYLVGDPSFPLPVSLDADGNQVFENTDTYKLCVGLKKNGGSDARRTLAADMLNYGAAAQAYFDFDAEPPVNTNLSTEEQTAMDY